MFFIQLKDEHEKMTTFENPLTLDEALTGRKTDFRNGGIVVLNIILSLVQLSSYATGYDGSMMSEFPNLPLCQFEKTKKLF